MFLSFRVYLWEIIPQILFTHNMIYHRIRQKQRPEGLVAEHGRVGRNELRKSQWISIY